MGEVFCKLNPRHHHPFLFATLTLPYPPLLASGLFVSWMCCVLLSMGAGWAARKLAQPRSAPMALCRGAVGTHS